MLGIVKTFATSAITAAVVFGAGAFAAYSHITSAKTIAVTNSVATQVEVRTACASTQTGAFPCDECANKVKELDRVRDVLCSTKQAFQEEHRNCNALRTTVCNIREQVKDMTKFSAPPWKAKM